jgi:hypothetical protein
LENLLWDQTLKRNNMAKTAANGKILGMMVEGYNNIQPFPTLDTVKKKKGGQVKNKKKKAK